jgi:hypothetical protein
MRELKKEYVYSVVKKETRYGRQKNWIAVGSA